MPGGHGAARRRGGGRLSGLARGRVGLGRGCWCWGLGRCVVRLRSDLGKERGDGERERGEEAGGGLAVNSQGAVWLKSGAREGSVRCGK